MKRYAIVHKMRPARNIITFNERAEANYHLTDAYAHEAVDYIIIDQFTSLQNVEIDNLHSSDAPDYCDAYISYAEFDNGEALTQDQLESIPSDLTYEYIINSLY